MKKNSLENKDRNRKIKVVSFLYAVGHLFIHFSSLIFLFIWKSFIFCRGVHEFGSWNFKENIFTLLFNLLFLPFQTQLFGFKKIMAVKKLKIKT